MRKNQANLAVCLTQQYHFRLWQDASRKKVLWEDRIKNLVTTEGMNKYLDATLVSGLTGPLWYLGLVDNAAFTSYLVADTAAKITTAANPPTTNGWQEWIAYSETVRQTWTPGTISAGSVDNVLSPAAFTINGVGTLRGAFMSSSNVKGGATGTLLGEADFSVSVPVVPGNVIDAVTAAFFTVC